MARGADKYGLFKASDAKRHGNLQPSGLSFRVHLGYGGSIPRFGRKSKRVPQPTKPCPSVVPMLSRDHVFRCVAVACDSFRKVLSHLFLRRTCLTARCRGISAPLRITLVREFNCADTVMHERYTRKRKTHRKTDAQSSLYIPRHRNAEMFLKCEKIFQKYFLQ